MKTNLFKIVGVLFVIVMILFASACTQKVDVQTDANELSEAAIAEIEASVNAQMKQVAAYAEAADAENLLNIFDSSGPGSYISGWVRHASYQEYMEGVHATYKAIASQDLPNEWKVFVLSPDVALTSVAGSDSVIDKEGTIYEPTPIAATFIWVRKGDEWLIHSIHEASKPRELSE